MGRYSRPLAVQSAYNSLLRPARASEGVPEADDALPELGEVASKRPSLWGGKAHPAGDSHAYRAGRKGPGGESHPGPLGPTASAGPRVVYLSPPDAAKSTQDAAPDLTSLDGLHGPRRAQTHQAQDVAARRAGPLPQPRGFLAGVQRAGARSGGRPELAAAGAGQVPGHLRLEPGRVLHDPRLGAPRPAGGDRTPPTGPDGVSPREQLTAHSPRSCSGSFAPPGYARAPCRASHGRGPPVRLEGARRGEAREGHGPTSGRGLSRSSPRSPSIPFTPFPSSRTCRLSLAVEAEDPRRGCAASLA